MEKLNPDNAAQPTTTSFFTFFAYATLLLDTYLVLASVATRMMKDTYTSYLPPFGSVENTERVRFFILIVAAWTAALAIGCLKKRRRN